eukprot:1341557-Alexandrium_andersonii.AAC.1
MGEARVSVLDDQEVSVAVGPLHPALLGGHKVARQGRPRARNLICARPLQMWGCMSLPTAQA